MSINISGDNGGCVGHIFEVNGKKYLCVEISPSLAETIHEHFIGDTVRVIIDKDTKWAGQFFEGTPSSTLIEWATSTIHDLHRDSLWGAWLSVYNWLLPLQNKYLCEPVVPSVCTCDFSRGQWQCTCGVFQAEMKKKYGDRG